MNNLVMGQVMPTPASSDPTLQWLAAPDGHRIPWRHWPQPSARAVIHIVHGMSEHSGCYADVAALCNAQGYAVIAHDHRAHGHACPPAALGNIDAQQHWPGIRADMAQMNAEIRRLYPEQPLIVLGHSMGSFIAQDFAQHQSENLNLLVLEGSSYEAPWFTGLASRLIAGFECWRQGDNGRSALIQALSFGGFNRKFRAPRTAFDWLSRNEFFVDRYIADPLCGAQASNAYWRDFLLFLSRLFPKRQLEKVRADLPLYLFSGSRDPVGHDGRGVSRLAQAYHKAGCHDVTLRLYPEARHDLLHENNREEVLHDLFGWLQRHLP